MKPGCAQAPLRPGITRALDCTGRTQVGNAQCTPRSADSRAGPGICVPSNALCHESGVFPGERATRSRLRARRAQDKFLVSRIRVSPGRKGDPVSAQGEPGPGNAWCPESGFLPGERVTQSLPRASRAQGEFLVSRIRVFLGETVTRSLPGASCGVLKGR